MVITADDYNRMRYGNLPSRNSSSNRGAGSNTAGGSQPTRSAAPARAQRQTAPAAAADPEQRYSAEDVANAIRYARREMAEVQQADRKRFWKKFAIWAAVLSVIAWFGHRQIQKGKELEADRASLQEKLLESQQEKGMDFYEEEDGYVSDAGSTYSEPVYHPQNGRVSFEIPLPEEHPVSSPIKTGVHEVTAGTRDFLGDAEATLHSVAGLAYAGADARRGVETWKSAGVEGRAHRSKVREDRKRDKLRTESRELANERTKQNMQIRRQREAQREADRLRRIKEQEAKRIQSTQNKQRQAAEKLTKKVNRASETQMKRELAKQKREQQRLKKQLETARREAARKAGIRYSRGK